jgi:hypothetical protein
MKSPYKNVEWMIECMNAARRGDFALYCKELGISKVNANIIEMYWQNAIEMEDGDVIDEMYCWKERVEEF